eukprot:TRINITY_DN11380_c0_g1_i1.p2 TRINITY_DN11380_c0_g1~~TRINITY_DN11380_c0_g1_i1.p2  ORF type:complete len:135 (+),score=38.13 TRINITY_DN11380_c0_g1_i1:51-407(+)
MAEYLRQARRREKREKKEKKKAKKEARKRKRGDDDDEDESPDRSRKRQKHAPSPARRRPCAWSVQAPGDAAPAVVSRYDLSAHLAARVLLAWGARRIRADDPAPPATRGEGPRRPCRT